MDTLYLNMCHASPLFKSYLLHWYLRKRTQNHKVDALLTSLFESRASPSLSHCRCLTSYSSREPYLRTLCRWFVNVFIRVRSSTTRPSPTHGRCFVNVFIRVTSRTSLSLSHTLSHFHYTTLQAIYMYLCTPSAQHLMCHAHYSSWK